MTEASPQRNDRHPRDDLAQPRSRASRRWLPTGLGGLLLLATMPAAAVIPVQTYYVPMPEDELLTSFRDMTVGCRQCATPRSPIRTLVSIAVAADGTQILYDQHEDGYEPDDRPEARRHHRDLG